MVTLADRKIGTNFLVYIVNLRQSVPQRIEGLQRGIQQDYNAYCIYMNSRCKMFKDRGWKINISNEQLPDQTEDRFQIHPKFEWDNYYGKRKFVPADELRQYQKIIVCGVFLKEDVLSQFMNLKKINPETYIAPTLSFTTKFGYDNFKVDKNYHNQITISDYIYV